MRTRLLLSGAALAAAALLGTTAATAQAAPSDTAGSTASVTSYWKKIGRFSWSDCVDLRDSYAGRAECRGPYSGKYDLWILVP
ncbi:hypothetical protein ACFVFS_02000 [Kitasatospora sp. NPDC057692]|uniref:hypothetical protein n=1 Tax=Kitasatospora sp. NPDC057692 TaxID=3346215 RepID=UPI0036C9748E